MDKDALGVVPILLIVAPVAQVSQGLRCGLVTASRLVPLSILISGQALLVITGRRSTQTRISPVTRHPLTGHGVHVVARMLTGWNNVRMLASGVGNAELHAIRQIRYENAQEPGGCRENVGRE